jgi:hypothetical protein
MRRECICASEQQQRDSTHATHPIAWRSARPPFWAAATAKKADKTAMTVTALILESSTQWCCRQTLFCKTVVHN